MLQRLIVPVAFCLAMATPAGAEVLRSLGGVNTYENGPVFKNLLSYAERLNLWTGTDAQGRRHNYSESINVGFEGLAQRAQPGTPITFEEVVALWNEYRDTGRTVRVHSDVGWSILNPDGSFQAAGHRIQGDFRLCRAPGAIGVAIAAVAAKVRGG